LLSTLNAFVKSTLSWKTNRKLLIFESDDWGSIRMPSLKVYESLKRQNVNLESEGGDLFNRFDTLENEDDLTALFNVLTSVKDKYGKHAVFTAVCNTANPNFDAIRENKFEKYIYESFIDTYEKYHGSRRVFSLWQEGISQGVWMPQSHSREHLNVNLWMNALRNSDKEALIGFDQGMWGYDRKGGMPSFQRAFIYGKNHELEGHFDIIKDGLLHFESIFGFSSLLFVPPNGIMDESLEKATAECGVKALFAVFKNYRPKEHYRERLSIKYLGKTNALGQKYILRNCLFEPNQPGLDWVEVAMKDIDYCFKNQMPAILGPHRKNFVGGLHEINREKSLDILRKLLKKVIAKYPDVEFASTPDLIEVMNDGTKH
jgi:hypothetical protein